MQLETKIDEENRNTQSEIGSGVDERNNLTVVHNAPTSRLQIQTSCSDIDVSSAGEEILSATEASELRRFESNRKVTQAFFLVGVLFISIALPVTITATIFGLHPLYGIMAIFEDPSEATYNTILLRFPYSLVALIDPFLYMFSNALVKEKLKMKLRKLCCCCCRRRDLSEV